MKLASKGVTHACVNNLGLKSKTGLGFNLLQNVRVERTEMPPISTTLMVLTDFGSS